MKSEEAHGHPIDPERVAAARKGVLSTDESRQVARLFRLLADPTRARVTSALAAVDELCVGDIALAVDANENAVSYALGQLRTAGVVSTRRAGRVIYYRLADRRFRGLVELVRRRDI
jgi:DNA-binding transcriptional ArsR family regulator